MTKARLDGLYLMLLGSVVFVLLSVALQNTAGAPLEDFKAHYYPARTLIQHGDPYMESEVLRVYRAEGGEHASDTAKMRLVATRFEYPPSVFTFTVPFAMLPWGPAHMVWTAITIGGLIFASFTVWKFGAANSPIVSGALVGFLLANSEVLIITGNAAGIVISLCVLSVCWFLGERFTLAGILCLAVGLAVKPQIAGPVWLYFLLAGGVHRKRALQALLATVALSLPAVLWVWHLAPHWMQEMHSNMLAFSARGGLSDPGPASSGAHGLAMVISLQAAVSFFCDDPRVYDTASYLICAPLALAWVFATLRSRFSPERAWLGMAAMSALTMLPVYHRQYDSKLLLLTIPACAMLWAEGGLTGWLALGVTTAGLVLNGDIPWAILLAGIGKLHLPATGISSKIVTGVQVFPAPLILLAVGVFYLWIYARRSPGAVPSAVRKFPDAAGGAG